MKQPHLRMSALMIMIKIDAISTGHHDDTSAETLSYRPPQPAKENPRRTAKASSPLTALPSSNHQRCNDLIEMRFSLKTVIAARSGAE
jgi:tRNA(Ile)-lysidine synthase TilS/MesJ